MHYIYALTQCLNAIELFIVHPVYNLHTLFKIVVTWERVIRVSNEPLTFQCGFPGCVADCSNWCVSHWCLYPGRSRPGGALPLCPGSRGRWHGRECWWRSHFSTTRWVNQYSPQANSGLGKRVWFSGAYKHIKAYGLICCGRYNLPN